MKRSDELTGEISKAPLFDASHSIKGYLRLSLIHKSSEKVFEKSEEP